MGHANSVSPTPQNENPGALAGATGVEFEVRDGFGGYARVHALATELCRAIRVCPPKVAAPILAAALEEIGAGAPPPTLRKAMVEARDWAQAATIFELRAYAAACVEAMGEKDKASFAAWIAGAVAGPAEGGR